MKRTLTTVSALLLATSLVLAGCSATPVATSTPASAATAVTASSATASTEATATATPEATPAPRKDLSLRVYRANFGKTAVGTEVEKLWLEKAAAYAGVNLTITFDEVPYKDFGEKSKIYLAAGDFPDIFQAQTDITTINNLGQGGALLNLKNYESTFVNMKTFLDTGANRLFVLDEKGDYYCAPSGGLCNDSLYGTQWTWLARADVFKANNLKQPTTPEELYQVCKQLKAIYPDSYPLGSLFKDSWYSLERVLLMINHMDVPDWMHFENGKYFYGMFDKEPQFKQVVEYLKKLYDEKLLDPEYFTNSTDQAFQKGVNDKNFIFPNGFTEYAWNQLSSKGKPDLQWAVVPRIKAFDGTIGYKPGSNTQPYIVGNTLVTCINAKVAEPEAVCRLIDYNYSPESITLLNYGIEGKTYTKGADGKLTFVDAIVKAENPREAASVYGISLSMSCRSGLILGPEDVDAAALLDKQVWCYIDGDYKKSPAYTYTAKYEGGKDSVAPGDLALSITKTQDDKDMEANSFTPIATFMSESMIKFITGQLSMDQWDATIAKAKTMGDYHAVVDMYNKRYEEAKAKAAALGIK